jgi:hypothetical protein
MPSTGWTGATPHGNRVDPAWKTIAYLASVISLNSRYGTIYWAVRWRRSWRAHECGRLLEVTEPLSGAHRQPSTGTAATSRACTPATVRIGPVLSPPDGQPAEETGISLPESLAGSPE